MDLENRVKQKIDLFKIKLNKKCEELVSIYNRKQSEIYIPSECVTTVVMPNIPQLLLPDYFSNSFCTCATAKINMGYHNSKL